MAHFKITIRNVLNHMLAFAKVENCPIFEEKKSPPSVLVGNRAKILFKSHTNHRPHRVQEKCL